MIGIVVVSHSAKLAEGVCELAAEVAQGRVLLAPAGGTDSGIGTDAFRVRAAIESVIRQADGVAVMMDLGSAVLSAEMALEMLDEAQRNRVRLCPGPLVEGVVSAASLAGAGASFEEIVAAGKQAEHEPAALSSRVTLKNVAGLHARPAAKLVRLARSFRASISVENETAGKRPVDGGGINGLLLLAARQGHTLAFHASGAQAREALAALVAFVESGCGEASDKVEPTVAAAGVGASQGIAIGPLVRLQPADTPIAGLSEIADVEGEVDRLRRALEEAREETSRLYAWASQHAGADRAGIFDAQLLSLDDRQLAEAAYALIREQRLSAEGAWRTASERVVGEIEALDDPYLRARAGDIRDAALRVMRRLTGVVVGSVELREPSIVTAFDISPSEVQQLDRRLTLGLCLEAGSATAHGIILARAMGIPAVVGAGPSIEAVEEGTILAIDGDSGRVWVSPDSRVLAVLNERKRAWLDRRAQAEAMRRRPAATRDGHRIKVFANLSSVEEAPQAVELGAEGVGVLRTEFLFLRRSSPPDEEEQYQAYATIARALDGRPLIVRTLDIGGDKPVPYIESAPEQNPFLGWRGIRLLLDREDLLGTQLRAIVRAGADVLLPMVSTIEELRRVKAMIAALQGDKAVRVGVMIETPAAVAIADHLAREASFFSIGSNDLIQYMMVADRTNARVAPMASPWQPAVLRTLASAVASAQAAGIEVGLCGELAGEKRAMPLLIGMGFDELSASAALIPSIKQSMSQWSRDDAREILRRAMQLDTAEAVEALL